MVSAHALSWLSTVALVLGALLVGDAIHGTIVTNQYPFTSPAALFRLVFGLLSIWLGARVRAPVQYVPSDEDGGDASRPDLAGREDEYDPSLSPFGEGPVHRGDRPDVDRSRGTDEGSRDERREGG